jgi:hypothetical protein
LQLKPKETKLIQSIFRQFLSHVSRSENK